MMHNDMCDSVTGVGPCNCPNGQASRAEPTAAAPPDVGEMHPALIRLMDLGHQLWDDGLDQSSKIINECCEELELTLLSQSQPKPEPGGEVAEMVKRLNALANELIEYGTDRPGAGVTLRAALDVNYAARLLSAQNVGAREVVVEKNDLRNFGEALLCAEYAITNPRSDQQFALVAVRAALADLNAAAMLAKVRT